MQNKTTLQTPNEILTANEPWHRGSGFTWMLLALAGLVFFLSGAVAKAQFTFATDNAGNYGGNWSNGSDGGSGFGGWGLSAGADSGSFIGNPANNGMGTTGIGTTAFGMYSSGSGYMNASRGFDTGMQVGDKLSFQWAMNWDANSGSKGFDLKSGGTTVFNLNNGGSSTITVTGGTLSSNYGTDPMNIEISRTSSSQYSVTIGRRDGSGNYTATLNSSSSIDNLNFYIGNQNDGNGNRNIYFNNLTIGNNGTYGNTQTESRALTGSGALTVNNNSTLTLTSDGNTFTGGTTVASGSTLKVGAGGGTGDLNGSVANSGNVNFDRTGSLTYSGAISGSGSVTKSSAGTVTLSGANSYSGGTTINGGTLSGTTTSIQGAVANNASLEFSQSGNGTFSGALSGTGTLVKKDTGNVTLGNANSGYSGGVYVDAGTLTAGEGGGFGTGSVFLGQDNVSSTATVAVGDANGGTSVANDVIVRAGGGTRTISSANSSGSNTFSGNVYLDGDVSLSSSAGGRLILSGRLDDGLGSGNYTATITAGSVEFSGSSSNVNLTSYTVSGGELRMNKSGADAVQSTLNISGGATATLVAADQLGSSAVVNNTGTLATGNNSDSFGTLNSSGSITGSGTLTAGTYNISGGTVSANLGAGTLNVTGDATLNGESAATTVAVSGSGTDLNLGSGANRLSSSADVTVASGSRLNLTSSQTLSTLKEAGSENGGTADIGSGATLTVNGENKGTNYMNSISGSGGLTMSGSGSELNLYGTQSYTGKTTVTAGTLATQVALASTDLEASGGTLESKGADKFADGATITVSGGTLKTGGNDTITRLNATSGTLNLTDDTLTVTGTNGSSSSVGTNVTATGGTISVAGTLDYQSTNGTTALSIASGGTLTGSGTTTGSLSVGSGGTLSLGNSPGTLTVGDTTFFGGGKYTWEITDFTGSDLSPTAGQGSDWDWLNINGSLTIDTSAATSPFIIDIVSLMAGSDEFDFTKTYSFAIATASGGITNFSAAYFDVRTANFTNFMTSSGYTAGSWSIGESENSLLLTYSGATLNNVSGASAIPEPSSASLLVLGLAAVLVKRRRVARG